MATITQGNVGAAWLSSTPLVKADSPFRSKRGGKSAYNNPYERAGNKPSGSGIERLIPRLVERLKGRGKGKDKCRPRIPELILDKAQDSAIRKRFNIGGSLGYGVQDVNRDGELSAGDRLVISGGITGGVISTTILNAEDVAAINGTSSNNDARDELQANMRKWQDAGVENYSFTLQRNCFCIFDAVRPVDIEVQNGKVTSAVFSDTGEPLTDSAGFNSLTVDDLFGTIGEAIDSNAERIDVTYDPMYGYPTSIYIDQNSLIADEELGFNVTNFSDNNFSDKDEPRFTTLAVGEEDGGFQPVPIDPPVRPEDPIATTQAIGEEDGGIWPITWPIDPVTRPIDKEGPIFTTLALGEEGDDAFAKLY